MIHPQHEDWNTTITLAQYRHLEARLEQPLTEFLFGPRSAAWKGSMSGRSSALHDRNRLLGQRMGL